MRLNLFNKAQMFWPAAVVCLAACGDNASTSFAGLFSDSSRAIASRQEAEALAGQLVGGRVLTSKQDVERDRDVYGVEVVRPSGSVVEIEIEVSTGRVVEVESDSPAAEDDLDVGGGLLTLQQAIAIALENSPGTVVAWEIERNEDDAGWEWEIEIRDAQGNETEVEIDAETGEAETDDDGNDNEPWDDDGFDSDDFDSDDADQLPAAVESIVSDTMSGFIESFERDEAEGFSKWEIDVRTAPGASVEIELSATSGRLIEADGSEGPFDYTFTPDGYITLAQALATASVAAGDIESWSLDRKDGRMIYELDLLDGDDVEVDAIEGIVIDDDR
ncbi:MAG: PepSY domain-containing protein [Myxococcota bacterium]